MKAIFSSSSSSDLIKIPTFIKIITFSLLSLSVFLLFKHFSDTHPEPFSFPTSTSVSTSISNATATAVVNSTNLPLLSIQTAVPPPTPVERPPEVVVVERTGIIDENGVMTDNFVIGDFDPGVIEGVLDHNAQEEERGSEEKGKPRAKIVKYKVCDESMSDYIPCLDNSEAISRLNSSDRGENYERHCPEKGKELDCLVPRPKGYKLRIPWPRSRNEVWSDNIARTHLVEDSPSWISRKKDKFIFPGGGAQFIHGADQYIDQISKMVPDIAFGRKTRVALDIGCGVGTFGAYLFKQNVTTLSVAPKDINDNQIQLAMERGVPAMVAAFATHRLLYPSQAFDLIHCSSCGINWTRDDGILLLEVNRVLRAGGYFVWAPQSVHEDNVEEQWKEMDNLTGHICWELVKNEGYISTWRKPLNNSCYFSRSADIQPQLCDPGDDPENVWDVGLKACITRLPHNGFGANVTMWPARLHHPPERLFSIEMDAEISRKEIYSAATKYWNDIVDGYVRAFHWKKLRLRNVMDMKAGYGGFAVALHDFQIDCWVMNVVPVSGSNTLPVIYDRGLIGVMHDWCEPFDTYPRTYDLLNAAGLFSVEQNRHRCDISTIMLEMDRILRPGGRAFIRDTTAVIYVLQEISKAMGWVCYLYDSGEGPHASWKLLNCEKRL